jgi:hypothetical protein
MRFRFLLEQLWNDRRRFRLLAIGISSAVVVLLLSLFVVPSLVLSRAEARIKRLGLSLDADDVDVGWSSVAFDGLTVTSDADPKLKIRLARLEVGFSWWRGLSVREAVRSVDVEKARINATVSSLAAVLNKTRSEATPTPAPAAPSEQVRPLPNLTIADAQFELIDEHGKLIVIEGGHLSLLEQRFEAKAKKVSIGSKPGEVIDAQDVSASGLLEGSRPSLTKARVNGALLTWALEGPEADTAAQLPSSRGRTLARLMGARRALLKPSSSADSPASSNRRSISELLDPHAAIELNGVHVVADEKDGTTRELLHGLSVRLGAEGDKLRLEGEGNGAQGGSLSWNVLLNPEQARIEGDVALKNLSLALFGPVLPPLPFHDLESTRLNGSLRLANEGLESVKASGNIVVEGLAFASDGLARTPVGPVTLAAKGDGTWTPARRELALTSGSFRVGGVTGSAVGMLAWPPGGYRVSLNAELPKTSCAKMLNAVPVGLLDELATIEVKGDISGRLVVEVDSANLDATKVDFDVKDACKFGAVPELLDLSRFQQPFIHRVLEPDGTLFEMETGLGTPAWTPIELVSPFFLQGVIAHEDGRFFGHHGFAEPEIAVALSRNLKAKAFKFGASTITMQLVKNVFLQRDKLLSRKIQEALIVWWLEQNWDKRRILELYVNVIEYGPAIYGIRNAALHYFGTIPMSLTPAQSAFLASILPSPKTLHSYYEKGQLSTSMKGRLAAFLKHMHSRQRIDDDALAFGVEELENFRFYAPDQPPPPPPAVRGTAAPMPFGAGNGLVDPWDETLGLPGGPPEDGTFGAAP